MIEEIKKEIEDAMWNDGIAMTMDKLFKILDKYNNKENNKLKEVKEELINIRKECFNQMSEKYQEDGESNEAHFLNFQVLPSIDKVLSIIGSD